jgi:hypothetical protein
MPNVPALLESGRDKGAAAEADGVPTAVASPRPDGVERPLRGDCVVVPSGEGPGKPLGVGSPAGAAVVIAVGVKAGVCVEGLARPSTDIGAGVLGLEAAAGRGVAGADAAATPAVGVPGAVTGSGAYWPAWASSIGCPCFWTCMRRARIC